MQHMGELEREKQHRVQFQSQEDYRNEQKLIETREVETEKENIRYNGEAINGLTQAEREWQEHLQMEEQLKQQWEMEQEQERERQQIRLMMSDAAAGDQFDDFFDNEHAWVSSDDDQINHVHLTTLPPVTQVAPEEVPISKKEKKEMEKALKQQKEKEEKERKKQEKELKKARGKGAQAPGKKGKGRREAT